MKLLLREDNDDIEFSESKNQMMKVMTIIDVKMLI